MSSYSVHFLLPPFLFSLVSFPLLSPSVFLSSFASVSSYHFNLCCCFFTSLLLLLNFLLCLFTSLLLLVLLLLLLFLPPPPSRTAGRGIHNEPGALPGYEGPSSAADVDKFTAGPRIMFPHVTVQRRSQGQAPTLHHATPLFCYPSTPLAPS